LTAAEFDRETQSSHVINISCHDNGRPAALTSVSTLNVVIDDVNDNKPAFSQHLYTGESTHSYTCNSPVGNSVVKRKRLELLTV